ncbi:MAG: hypothetical protein LBQ27_01740 [Clostridiales bacterium]|jgi:hypothetical protein|nr:hypothetical protein [Clostridiales bacterium]
MKKKLLYILVFLVAFGTVILMLPYFRNTDQPRMRFVYASAISAEHATLPGDGIIDGDDYTGGGITPADVVEVKSGTNVVSYKLVLSGAQNYILLNDIILPAKPFTIEGLSAGQIFNGNGYKIDGVVIRHGLVSKNTGTIKNLIIGAGCVVTGAAVAEENLASGVILNVKNYASVAPYVYTVTSGNVKTEYSIAGGLVFDNYGTISGCDNFGVVNGNGGIAQINKEGGLITNCGNEGRITGAKANAGGIAGENYGKIEKSSNGGAVDMKAKEAGGIAGISHGVIDDSENYETATVAGVSSAGGIAGLFKGEISNCRNYGLIKATGSAGVAGGIAGKSVSSDSKITASKNTAVVIGDTSKGILGSGEAKLENVVNYGRLNGKTELTVQIDEFLEKTKIIIMAIVAAGVVAAMISIGKDRYKTIRDRRAEIESVLNYGA